MKELGGVKHQPEMPQGSINHTIEKEKLSATVNWSSDSA